MREDGWLIYQWFLNILLFIQYLERQTPDQAIGGIFYPDLQEAAYFGLYSMILIFLCSFRSTT